MIREDLFEKRVAYKSYVGKLYGFGTAESNNVSLDTVLLCDLVVELIEEVKGLREELKVVKTEAPKVEETKATSTAKAPSKTTK